MTDDKAKKESSHKTKMKKLKENVTRGEDKFQNFEVVLDELTYMLSFKYLHQTMILDALKNRPENQSVVVTGRGGGSNLADMADTVSEIKEVKHAYNSGVMARKGVDY